jgi:hypothetical protein
MNVNFNFNTTINPCTLRLIKFDDVLSDVVFSMILKIDSKRSVFQNVTNKDNCKEEIINLLKIFNILRLELIFKSSDGLLKYNTTTEYLSKCLKEKFNLNDVEKLMKQKQ